MAPPNQLPINSARGLWTQTATIDWCESNYELTYYIAEFWNSISNLAFILPQVVQYIELGKHHNVEPSFRLAFLSLALVGVGSLCFHMTLSKPMQMFDETSMIVVTLHGLYLLYIIDQPNVNRKKLAAVLISYGLVFLSFYVFLVAWPVFHHTAFGLIVYASAAIGYKLKKTHGPHHIFWTVLILQHLAFGFWLIDKHFCDVLTQFRDHFPFFVKPALQFHALWHLLMGISSHIFICSLIRLRMWTKYREEFIFQHQWFGLWIRLRKVDPENSPLARIEKQRDQKQRLQARDLLQISEADLRFRNTLKEPNHGRPNDGYDLNQNQVHLKE